MAERRHGYILDLSAEDKEVARTELGEDESQTASQIIALREALKQHKHFVTREDDSFLLMWLRKTKFSQTTAIDMIETFTKNRITDPNKKIYTNEGKLTPEITYLLQKGGCFALPGIPSSGVRVVIMRYGVADYSKYSFIDLLRAAMLSLDIVIKDPIAQVRGIHVVMDWANVGLRLLPRLSLENLRVSASTFVSTCPCKMKAWHFINMPRILGAAVTIYKTLTNKEMKDRIHIHSSPEHFSSYVDPEILPEEYGGTAGKMEDLMNKFHHQVVDNMDELDLYSGLRYSKEHKIWRYVKLTNFLKD